MATITLIGADGEEVRFNADDNGSPTEPEITPGGMAPVGADAPPAPLRPTRAGSPAGEVTRRFSDYFDPIRRLANQLAAKIDEVDVKPSEVEISVGVKLTTKAGVVFVSAGADAEMNVKMTWKS